MWIISHVVFMADNSMKELLNDFVPTRPVLYSKAHKDYMETRTVI